MKKALADRKSDNNNPNNNKDNNVRSAWTPVFWSENARHTALTTTTVTVLLRY